MSDSITIRGFVATEIKSSTTPGGVGTASFRLGSTERRYDRASSTWVDGNTNWFTVQGYRQLAGNIGCSIKKGQRVIVVGRLKMRSWENDGRIYHVAEIDAESVGHDLMWGSANYTRSAGAGNHGSGGLPSASAAGAKGGTGEQVPEREDRDDEDSDGEDSDGEDNDGDGSAGQGSHGVFVEGTNGGLEELDEETGELKAVAA
jgi:single-strand DNA-binding protein